MNPELEKVKSLAVDLHGRRVGIINRLGGDRHLLPSSRTTSITQTVRP
jgi:hypothetical protein